MNELVKILLPYDVPMFFMKIPAGNFRMGGAESKRIVTISKPFYLSKFPVTNIQYNSVYYLSSDSDMHLTKHEKLKGFELAYYRSPEVFRLQNYLCKSIMWVEAMSFCKNIKSTAAQYNTRFRLPTEAEWEYACRAGRDGNLPKIIHDFEARPVGYYPSNPWGLHDMEDWSSEWCLDEYLQDLPNEPCVNPFVYKTQSEAMSRLTGTRNRLRVLRTGASTRCGHYETNQNISYAGFRVVMETAT